MIPFDWRSVVGAGGNLRAKMIARELVQHSGRLLEVLTAARCPKTTPGVDSMTADKEVGAAEQAARDYIYRVVEPIVLDPELDERQPEKKGE